MTAPAAPTVPDQLLSIPQVMELFGIKSRMTLRKFMQNKRDPLPCFRLGQKWRFQRDKVMYWLENRSR